MVGQMTERLISGEKFYMFFTVGFFFPFSPIPGQKRKQEFRQKCIRAEELNSDSLRSI